MFNNRDGFWIYHERQEAALCGQHALNNLVQGAVFTAQSLAETALELDQIELHYMAQNNEGGVWYVHIFLHYCILFPLAPIPIDISSSVSGPKTMFGE